MTTESEKTLYLIDGSSYIYRAFYAIRRLSNARGMPTQAVYGFAQMLLKVIREKRPDYVCVVFDAPGPNFRHEIFEPYKATRQKMPEDLVSQVPYIKDLVRYHGIAQMEMAGYEADDLIAALTRWGGDQNLCVVIVSGDKDLCQLVKDPAVQQWDPQKDRVFTEEEVLERFGVTTHQMLDYLALVGDSTDNIPGVKGVGEKSAKKLLEQWGSLDGIFAHIQEVSPGSVKEKLLAHQDMAYLSKRLASLKDDLPIPQQREDFIPKPPLKSELLKLYAELDFKSLLAALAKDFVEPGGAPPLQTSEATRADKIVSTFDQRLHLVSILQSQTEIGIDLDTSSDDSMTAELRGVAFSCGDEGTYYAPMRWDDWSDHTRPSVKEVLDSLAPLLSSTTPAKLSQNAKFQRVVLKRYGIELQGVAFDTMVASYLLDPGKNSHTVERLLAEYFGETMSTPADLAQRESQPVQPGALTTNWRVHRACAQAEAVRRLVPILRERLGNTKQDSLYEALELPLTETLAAMEYHGILVDPQRLQDLSLDFEKAMDQAAGKIFDLAQAEFNIQSPKQLAAVLFHKMGLPVLKKTKSGPSTDMSVLEELASEYPIAEYVLNYRSLAKLKGTYTDSLLKLIHPETNRLHTSYNQTITATGRLSSSDPNLQNIPIRSEEGRKIRAAFIAGPGNVLFSADYSQIELRILAHFSQDEHLLEAFHADADVHMRTAAEMLNIPPHEVTPEMRRQAKMINFGIIYGMGAFGLARRLRITNKTAKAAIDRYFERYRGVKRYIEAMVDAARTLGYTETLLGRRRMIPELSSRNFTVRQLGERLAINTPIQGTAADLIKKAMIDIDKALKKSGLKTAMLLQVHDELVFEVPSHELETARNLIRKLMEGVWDLSVPLKIDMGWGPNWANAHP